MAKSGKEPQLIPAVSVVEPAHPEHALELMAGLATHNPTWLISEADSPAAAALATNQNATAVDVARGMVCDARALKDNEITFGDVPVVWVFGKPDGVTGPSVAVDDEAVGRVAAEHLLERGFGVFGYLGNGEPSSALRLQGFRAALSGADCSCDEMTGIFEQDTSGTGNARFSRNKLISFLTTRERPVAVFCANDELAFMMARALAQLGLSVPGDVAILGSENLSTRCEVTPPGISSVDLNIRTIGQQAGELLDRMLRGQNVGNLQVVVQPETVVARHSTDYEPSEDSAMTVAMRYLEATPPEMLDLSEMYTVAPSSRRTLERRFTDRLGRSPAEEVRRRHMSHARQLLRTTELTLADIAVRCGYEHASHFCRAFKREHGVTPTEYREQDQD